jgi:hypothetical protein
VFAHFTVVDEWERECLSQLSRTGLCAAPGKSISHSHPLPPTNRHNVESFSPFTTHSNCCECEDGEGQLPVSLIPSSLRIVSLTPLVANPTSPWRVSHNTPTWQGTSPLVLWSAHTKLHSNILAAHNISSLFFSLTNFLQRT